MEKLAEKNFPGANQAIQTISAYSHSFSFEKNLNALYNSAACKMSLKEMKLLYEAGVSVVLKSKTCFFSGFQECSGEENLFLMHTHFTHAVHLTIKFSSFPFAGSIICTPRHVLVF